MMTVKNLRNGETVEYIGCWPETSPKQQFNCLGERQESHQVFDDFPVKFVSSGDDANGDSYCVYELPTYAQILRK